MRIDRRRTFAACNPHQAGERNGARAMMTPEERVRVHVQIEQENARKLKEWKEAQKEETGVSA